MFVWPSAIYVVVVEHILDMSYSAETEIKTGKKTNSQTESAATEVSSSACSPLKVSICGADSIDGRKYRAL
jgi:hypothetical protein